MGLDISVSTVLSLIYFKTFFSYFWLVLKLFINFQWVAYKFRTFLFMEIFHLELYYFESFIIYSESLILLWLKMTSAFSRKQFTTTIYFISKNNSYLIKNLINLYSPNAFLLILHIF